MPSQLDSSVPEAQALVPGDHHRLFLFFQPEKPMHAVSAVSAVSAVNCGVRGGPLKRAPGILGRSTEICKYTVNVKREAVM